MKVLLTGCSTSQVPRTGRSFKDYTTVFAMLCEALTMMGHEVDWRAVTVEDELDHDVALIGLHSLGSHACTVHKYGALWAASQLPHACVLDDWRVEDVFKQMTERHLWHCANLDDAKYHRWLAATKHQDVIDKARVRWQRKMHLMVTPVCPWGDGKPVAERHGRVAHHRDWSPLAFVKVPNLSLRPQRVRAWVLASLSSQVELLSELKPEWPVLQLGGDAPYMPESIVHQIFTAYAGAILPAHSVNNQNRAVGWWRPRYLTVPGQGCVMWTPRAEDLPLKCWHRLSKIEAASSKDLRLMAEDQRDAVDRWMNTQRDLEHLDEILRIAKQAAI